MLVCAGVQYLQRPSKVFAEVVRVLRPDERVVVSYADPWFPSKAVAVWLALYMAGRAALVRHCLDVAGFADVGVTVLADGKEEDTLVAVEAPTLV